MEDNEEPLVFSADTLSEADTCSTYEDNTSESGETPSRKFATFSLSMSDFGDTDDRSNSTIDDDYMNDVSDFSDAQRTERMPFWRRETRLSRILGISADERCEKRLMLGEDPSMSLQQEMQKIQKALRPNQIDVGSSESSEEFEFLDSGPIRRCISLKSNKTPPGTPRRKKEVRFADALGLDLESIRQILNQDDPPVVPDSAMKGLNLADDKLNYDSWSYTRAAKFVEQYVPPQRIRHLCACFAQPGYSPDFARRVEERRVSLEHCTVDDSVLSVSGTIRVSNIAFEKQVIVRHTINGWMTFADEPAKYVSGGSTDNTTDQFSFLVRLPDYFDFSSRMEFSVMYIAAGQTYWDSNFGANYRIECHVEEAPAAVRRCDATPKLCSDESTVQYPFY